MPTYRGTVRNDTLNGSSSADIIDGKQGNDRLQGLGGNDKIKGGSGADTFIYAGSPNSLGTDTLSDFSRFQGDKISLSDVTLSGVTGLTWSGTTATKGGVWQATALDRIFVETSGDTTADLIIHTPNQPTLAQTDFIGVAAPTTAPPPASPTLVLSDDFSEGYKTEHWGHPFNGSTYWNGAFSWSAADTSVAPGSKSGNSMQIDITKHADGSWTTGGFNSFKAGQDILYGTVEFDAKVPELHGTMAAILMWPTSDVWPGPEVDILETPHEDVMHTLHWNDNGNDAYSFVRNQAFDETQWQHYKVTWTKTMISIAVDGVGVVAEWHDHIPREPMGFGVMGYVGSVNDTWMGGAPSSSIPAGSTPVTIEIDNFKMYQAPDVL
jgi:hypothetical protein